MKNLGVSLMLLLIDHAWVATYLTLGIVIVILFAVVG